MDASSLRPGFLDYVKERVAGDFTSLILFGSYARGDAHEDSDIDVLQVVREPIPSYRDGDVNFSVYTDRHLREMAQKGSLFVLHLVKEAKPIIDPQCFLGGLKSLFQERQNYAELRADVCRAAALLDVGDGEYVHRWKGLHSLALNLLRTHVYSILHDRGQLSFSMDDAVGAFGDERVREAMKLKGYDHPDVVAFRGVWKLLDEYCGGTARNEFGSIEALIVNSCGKSELTSVLGLRLLNESNSPLAYEEFAETAGV